MTMQEIIKNGFKRNDVLMWSAVAAGILWTANRVLNIIDGGYNDFFTNLVYVVCLITLCGAEFKKENNLAQGMIGALLVTYLFGNVRLVTSNLKGVLETGLPSRANWMLIFGAFLGLCLFINHFLLTNSKYKNKRRVTINQLIVLILLLLRTVQVLMNLFGSDFSQLSTKATIGLLAIIPTLNVIVCIEARNDNYEAFCN